MMKTYLAFLEKRLVVAGELLAVALKVKELMDQGNEHMPLIFEASTGRQVDIDVRGSRIDLEKRFANHGRDTTVEVDRATPTRRGRPKLGVVGREVTLLPRHWQWLDGQRGGASPTLRRLVDKARAENKQLDLVRQSQDRTNRFLSAIAGDLAGFEEATRALYVGDSQRFVAEMRGWPKDIRKAALEFSHDALAEA